MHGCIIRALQMVESVDLHLGYSLRMKVDDVERLFYSLSFISCYQVNTVLELDHTAGAALSQGLYG